MFDLHSKEMIEFVKNHLIKEHGVAFLSLSEQSQYNLIYYTVHEWMKEQRERQD